MPSGLSGKSSVAQERDISTGLGESPGGTVTASDLREASGLAWPLELDRSNFTSQLYYFLSTCPWEAGPQFL